MARKDIFVNESNDNVVLAEFDNFSLVGDLSNWRNTHYLKALPLTFNKGGSPLKFYLFHVNLCTESGSEALEVHIAITSVNENYTYAFNPSLGQFDLQADVKEIPVRVLIYNKAVRPEDAYMYLCGNRTDTTTPLFVDGQSQGVGDFEKTDPQPEVKDGHILVGKQR